MPEPATRLYLILPSIPDLPAFKPVLAEAIAAGDIACVLLPERGHRDLKAVAQSLMRLAQERDVAFLLDGDARLAARLGADGVHLAYSPDAVQSAVSSLGADAIVGAGALASRDDAMSAGEAGASYVMFGEPDAAGSRPTPEHTLDRVAWWAEIFNVPCVGYAGALEEVGPLADSGAEFVALGEAVWAHPRGAAHAIKEAQAILMNAVLTQ